MRWLRTDSFRRDLLARLAMARIKVPALRQRSEDIFYVAEALTRRAGRSLSAEKVEVEAVERLLLEPWPNNVRQLDATLAAVRRVDPELGLRLWALEEVLGERSVRATVLTDEGVQRAMAVAQGNASAAAAALGVSRGRLLRFRKREPR